MATMEYKPGTFCWVDLSTTDHEGAKKFYSSLFGWTADDLPVEGSVYSMMKKNGQNAAAIAPHRAPGMPTYWSSYVSVQDVDASSEKAKSLGGSVMMPPMDVMGAGRMSVVTDPTGANVCLWQAGEHKGADYVNDEGGFCWNELLTTDVNKAMKFYDGMFDWTSQTAPMGPGMEYTTMKNGERAAGGAMTIRPEWGPMPPNWGVYFTVNDCDTACAKVKLLGGKVLAEPHDIPGTGRFAPCMDPQGGMFSVIAMAPQAASS